MSDKHVLLAIYDNEAAADAAVAMLKTRDGVPDDAIGVLVLDDAGAVKVDKVGTRSAGKGAGIGLLLGLLGPVGIIGGTVGGSLLGMLHRKGLGLSEADRDRISGELEGGKAAVGVLAHSGEEDRVGELLTSLGGTLEVHPVTDDLLEEAAASAPPPPSDQGPPVRVVTWPRTNAEGRRMPEIAVRRARADEAAAVADVYLRSFAAGLPTVALAHTDDEVRQWFASVVVPARETWVAVDDSAVIALLVLHDGFIEQLYVAPERIGRGIGSRLVALAKARSPGGLQLYTFQVNERARRFYERHGFAVVELGDGSGNEEQEPDVLYRWAPAGRTPTSS